VASTIGQITVGTSSVRLTAATTTKILTGIRVSNGGSGKLYWGLATGVTTSTGYLLNNSGDQIAPASADLLSDVWFISDTAAQPVSIEIVGQSGITIPA